MKVFDFNIERGVFHFEIENLNADKHSHPVVEIVKATQGNFTLETDYKKYGGLTFAIIDRNVNHRVTSIKWQSELLMLESNSAELKAFLLKEGVTFSKGIFTTNEASTTAHLLNATKELATTKELKKARDKRVQISLEMIESGLQYDNLVSHLTSEVHLSESRLSHLFKEDIGISLKRYLVWSRLKNAISILLKENTSFTDASYKSGFYDQAHLSNAFKRFLGVNPSRAYNSRIIQF